MPQPWLVRIRRVCRHLVEISDWWMPPHDKAIVVSKVVAPPTPLDPVVAMGTLTAVLMHTLSSAVTIIDREEIESCQRTNGLTWQRTVPGMCVAHPVVRVVPYVGDRKSLGVHMRLTTGCMSQVWKPSAFRQPGCAYMMASGRMAMHGRVIRRLQAFAPAACGLGSGVWLAMRRSGAHRGRRNYEKESARDCGHP
jgi:hypothetical protein